MKYTPLPLPVLLLSLAVCPVAPAHASAPSAPSFVDLNFAHAAAQYTRMLAALGNDPGIPRSLEDGKVVTVEPRDWTSGF